MSENGNGRPIVRIGRKGKQWYALGDGEPFEVDVVEVHSNWVEVDRQFRNDKGEMPPENLLRANAAALQFAREVSGCPDVTGAEALEFICKITEEVDRLKDFFVPKFKDAPSSQESTELRFST